MATSSSPSESDFKSAIVFKEIAKRLEEVSSGLGFLFVFVNHLKKVSLKGLER